MTQEGFLNEYNYEVNDDLVALVPAEPRDSARLLVYKKDTNEVLYDTFKNLAEHLPLGALLVFNNTKVLPARIWGERHTGGKVELVCVELEENENKCKAIGNKKLEKGEVLQVGNDIVTVMETKPLYHLEGSRPIKEILNSSGKIPIPPYLKHTPLSEPELRTRYQTLFAKEEGSAAAPTASLHFTQNLFESLKAKGVETTEVTLHVGLGTFASVTPEALAEGKLHEEQYFISKESADAINEAKEAGRPVIPVGTTALRTLESAANGNRVKSGEGRTSIFIKEGYEFKIATGLITNFHVPKSSLLMLVAAMIGREKMFELYAVAKEKGFRFFSFGDGMFIS